MRVYVPIVVADVDRRRTEGLWTITPRRGWAVNRQLIAALPDEDDEGREFIASLTAASDSAAGMAMAVDVDQTAIGDEGIAGDVEVSGRFTDAQVACLLRVDPDDDESLLWFGVDELAGLLGE